MAPDRLIPVTDDHDTGGFFAAARRHELAVRICHDCGTALHVPTAHCHHCGSWDGGWHDAGTTGTLYTWTLVTHQVHPSYPVPYAVVLVELDDLPGVRLVGHLPGAPTLEAGMPMEVWFETIADDVVLPQWRPRTDQQETT